MQTYLALMSDTHGHTEFARPALRLFEPFQPIALLHAGDIGGSSILDLLPQDPSTHLVYGNCDFGRKELEVASTSRRQSWHGAFADIAIENRRIALLHGDDERRFQEALTSNSFDLLVHGHSHQKRCELVGGTLVVNPGAVYRANPHSVAVVELNSLDVTFLDVH